MREVRCFPGIENLESLTERLDEATRQLSYKADRVLVVLLSLTTSGGDGSRGPTPAAQRVGNGRTEVLDHEKVKLVNFF
ncbi:hypothetical protein ATANTOWER_006085 [Ataeniobius toweri]|uniref:Uncharacterized protein n=1 Tax=Ataeniobius toweri TaxID=208326 RepID=A0ABU7C902_9TELE|nr:hypothetical protein [Ataeniobius toweri]